MFGAVCANLPDMPCQVISIITGMINFYRSIFRFNSYPFSQFLPVPPGFGLLRNSTPRQASHTPCFIPVQPPPLFAGWLARA